MTIKEMMLNKLFSGRWLMTVAFTITACYMAVKGMFPVEAFVGLTTLVANNYFTRNDRAKEETNVNKGV
jgi:hypothetical protein